LSGNGVFPGRLSNIDYETVFGKVNVVGSNQTIEVDLNDKAIAALKAILPNNANHRSFSIALKNTSGDPLGFASIQTFNNEHPPILRVTWGAPGVEEQVDLKKK